MAQEQINEMVSNFLEVNQATYKVLRRQLNETITVNGKTLAEWFKVYHSIKIPEDTDCHSAKLIAARLMMLEQKASQSLIAANARLSVIDEVIQEAYEIEYSSLVEEAKANGSRLPAASYLETMARVATKTVQQQSVIAKIEQKFWQNIITYLTRMRKKLERIDMNNSLKCHLTYHIN